MNLLPTLRSTNLKLRKKYNAIQGGIYVLYVILQFIHTVPSNQKNKCTKARSLPSPNFNPRKNDQYSC